MFDIIIATYNRFEKALALAQQILSIDSTEVKQICIVDSTDHQSIYSGTEIKIKHILSPYKNQPYQRYLGFQNTSSPYVIFLDDDMEIVNTTFLKKVHEILQKGYAGVAIHFEDKHQNTSLNKIAKSAFNKNKLAFGRFMNWFTAYPNLPDGILGLCGVRGKQPAEGGITDFVSGGAFAAQRIMLYQNFNFELFNLYNQKIGKGEDAMIGYTLAKAGRVYYLPDLLFYHNDQQDSAYSINQYEFAKRVTFSRKYLSLEKTRLDDKLEIYAQVHFHWHTMWRVLGLIINYTLHKTDSRKQMLNGAIAGWKLAASYRFKFKSACTI